MTPTEAITALQTPYAVEGVLVNYLPDSELDIASMYVNKRQAIQALRLLDAEQDYDAIQIIEVDYGDGPYKVLSIG